ncbi:MAG: hypothetical protein WCH61_04285 [bacterium]
MKSGRITALVRRWWRSLVLVPVLAGAGAGCVSSVDTAAVTAAGGAYATAMNRLMLATGRVAVDTSSERLLQEELPASQPLEEYQRLAAADARRLDLLERLRDHNRLLGRYFALLGELTEAPEAVAIRERLQGISQALNETTAELRARPEFSPGEPGPSPAARTLVLGGRRPDDELRRDAPRLRSAFRTQDVLLSGLVTGVRRDFEVIRQAQEQRLVIAPLLSQDAVKNPEPWTMARRELLLLAVTIRELEKAQLLADRLTVDVDALLEAGCGTADLRRLEEDAARLTAACNGLANTR